MAAGSVIRRPVYRATLYALLVANALYFALAESPSKGLDAAAWLALLLLFEAETRRPEWLARGRRRCVLHAARVIAAAGVIAALLGYAAEGNVLDTINTALWIAVVILLELEVRFPRLVSTQPKAFRAAALILYGGLAVLVLLWAMEGLWFDAYDALLWLVAFATLELNVSREEQVAGAAK